MAKIIFRPIPKEPKYITDEIKAFRKKILQNMFLCLSSQMGTEFKVRFTSENLRLAYTVYVRLFMAVRQKDFTNHIT